MNSGSLVWYQQCPTSVFSPPLTQTTSSTLSSPSSIIFLPTSDSMYSPLFPWFLCFLYLSLTQPIPPSLPASHMIFTPLTQVIPHFPHPLCPPYLPCLSLWLPILLNPMFSLPPSDYAHTFSPYAMLYPWPLLFRLLPLMSTSSLLPPHSPYPTLSPNFLLVPTCNPDSSYTTLSP